MFIVEPDGLWGVESAIEMTAAEGMVISLL